VEGYLIKFSQNASILRASYYGGQVAQSALNCGLTPYGFCLTIITEIWKNGMMESWVSYIVSYDGKNGTKRLQGRPRPYW